MPPTLEDFPARRAYVDLIKAHEKLLGEFSDLFRQHGLTHVQFNVLRILVEGPAEGCSCQRVADELLNRVPDVTRLIDRMERSGLVRRVRCPEDRRVVRTKLTAKGRKLCEGLYDPVKRLHRRQFRHMSEAEIEALDTGLRKVLQGA